MYGYIYLIINKVNGHTYVGKHESSKEWFEDKYPGSGKLLKPAYKKYGIENFEKFFIQYCYDKESLNAAEKFWIAEYKSRGKAEYNIAKGGDGGNLVGGPTKGSWKKGHTPWNKGKKGCQVAWNKGIACYDETKNKISKSLKNKPLSNERKEQMSISRKGKHWYNNGIKEAFCFECPDGYKKGRLEMKWQNRDETGKFIKKGDK